MQQQNVGTCPFSTTSTSCVFEFVEITPYVVDTIKTAMVYKMNYTYRQPVCMALIMWIYERHKWIFKHFELIGQK